jgi:DNA polymerase III gamma/tau subunit
VVPILGVGFHIDVRIFATFFSLFYLCGAMAASAQDPGAQQDAEAAREKLLKASDQLDMIQSNSESTRIAVDAMKADVAKLQSDNATLKQQLSDLQAAFDQSEASRAKERQVLLDEVAKMVTASKSGGVSKSAPKHHAAASTAPPSPTPPVEKTTDASTAPASQPAADGSPAVPESGAVETPRPMKGYYHVVESGETLRLICSAYRQHGINVTVAEVEKANGLTDKSVLKAGQKLFIPKPEM